MTFEQSFGEGWEQTIQIDGDKHEGRNNKCKGPGVGAWSAYLRYNKEAKVATEEGARGRVVGGETIISPPLSTKTIISSPLSTTYWTQTLVNNGVSNVSLDGMCGGSAREMCIGPNSFSHRYMLLIVPALPRVFTTRLSDAGPTWDWPCLPWEGSEPVEIGQSYFLLVGVGTRLCTSAQLERAPELLFIRYAAV